MSALLSIAGVTTTSVKLADLVRLPSKNPNVMDAARFELLQAGIEAEGFLQPLLVVRREDGAFILVDGEHRVKACTNLGYEELPAIVAPDMERARRLRILLNKPRGELDHTLVGLELASMLELGEIETSDLGLMGYSAEEAAALIEATEATAEDDLLLGTNLSTSDEVATKTYNLTFKFKTESQRAKIREMLGPYGETLEDAIVMVMKELKKS